MYPRLGTYDVLPIIDFGDNGSGLPKFTILLKTHTITYFNRRKGSGLFIAILLLLYMALAKSNPNFPMFDDLGYKLVSNLKRAVLSATGDLVVVLKEKPNVKRGGTVFKYAKVSVSNIALGLSNIRLAF